ncbi:uncharacterized protein LOC144102386 [Amblyomma americanum]
MGAITALFQVISLVLNLTGLGFLLTLTDGVLPALCAITNTSGCETLLNGNTTCAAPISVTLPDTLNVSRCVNQTLLLCQNGTLASDRLVINVISTVTCLLTTLLGTNPGNMLNGLGCIVAGLIDRIPILNIGAFFLRALFRCT